jgi:signal transduction histidine kinase
VDGLQLRQVIVNLVTNALQAAKTPSGVKLKVWTEGSDLMLRVDDDGDGISHEALQRLFEPLFTTRARGVGLGLALCRRVAEKHGGSIRGGNLPEGGARFEARFAEAFTPSP